MTDELQSIRERFAAIIPGPWRWYGNTASEQIFLATVNRGRLIILSPETHRVEYVYNHNEGESYELSKISNTDVIRWCGAHGEGSDPETRESHCLCDELRDFLRPTDEPEALGYQDFDRGRVQFTRGLTIHADLRFADIPHDGWTDEAIERRKVHGGYMRSYREMARYEVLGTLDGYFYPPYRTKAEYEAEFGEPGNLYREDVIGLANPEATFIEHAPEDIGFLLKRVEELELELATANETIFGYSEQENMREVAERQRATQRSSTYECPSCGDEIDIREARAL